MTRPDPPAHFTRTEESPLLGLSFQGVTIRVNSVVRNGEVEVLTLHGAYQVTPDRAASLGVLPLQRAIVITVTAGLRCKSWNMVGQTFTFEDDERHDHGLIQGYFTADLLPHFPLDEGETGYVLVSMGTLLSDVVIVVPSAPEPGARSVA